ncbi:MAG: PAS domain S-box protein [Nostoc sp.]
MLKVNRLQVQDIFKIPPNSFVAKIASAIPILVGSLVLTGWWLEIEVLKRGFPSSLATMKFNTALCFVLSGMSLWLFLTGERTSKRGDEGKQTGKQRTIKNYRYSHILLLSRICAIVVTTIAALTLCEYLFGWNFGIDRLLFLDFRTSLATSHPGRMGVNTALNFILVSVALQFLNEQNHRSYWCAQILALITTLISFQVLMGYAYKVKVLYSIAPYTTSMALHTALLFNLLGIGILWAQTQQGLMRVVTNDSYGGLVARRLLVTAIAVPFLVGWVIVEAQRAGQYDPAFAVSVFAIVLIVIFTVLIWQSARVIEYLSDRRNMSDGLNLHVLQVLRAYEDKLASFVDANVIGIAFADVYGGIHQANDEYLRIIGYTQEDVLAGGLSWREITVPEHRYLDQQGIIEAKGNSKGTCTPYQKEYIRKDGSRIPILVGYVLLGEKREESVAFVLDLSERKQAQAEQQKLVSLVENSSDFIGIATLEGELLYINDAAQKLVGLASLEEVKQKAVLDYVMPEDKDYFQQYILPTVLSQGRWQGEFRFRHLQTGQAIPVDYNIFTVTDNTGEAIALATVTRNISEQKQAKEQILQLNRDLQRRITELQTLLEVIPIGIGIAKDPECQNIKVNPAFAKQLGISSDTNASLSATFDEKPTKFKIYSQGRELSTEELPMQYSAAHGVEVLDVELDVIHENGKIVKLLEYVAPLFDEEGNTRGCVGAFLDITERKQAEEALSLSYQRLKVLFETANELLSSQQPIELIDSVFRKLSEQIGLDVYFNYLIEDNSQVMQLKSYGGIFPELADKIQYLPFGQAVCGTVAQQRYSIAVENVQQSTDPKTELIRSLGISAYYCYPLIAQGRLLGTLSFGSRTRLSFTENQKGMMQAVCDQIAIAMERASLIASLQQQTEQLQQANRIKDEFLGILSHELRSPLNAILGWAQVLQRSKLSETQIAKGMETIERNAKAQTQLIEDLLDISRMNTGKLRLNVRTCNLVPIIESSLETVSLAAQSKEIDLRFSLIPSTETENLQAQSPSTQHPQGSFKGEDSRFLVSGDFDRFQQIIWNLLSNAIKFTPPKGRVEVQLSVVNGEEKQQTTNKYAQIQVIDTGIGISANFLPHVFERFRQADSSSTRTYGGLGLGLAIVRHLVELHGGTIRADSLGEQQGATFTVKLPLLKSHSLT